MRGGPHNEVPELATVSNRTICVVQFGAEGMPDQARPWGEESRGQGLRGGADVSLAKR